MNNIFKSMIVCLGLLLSIVTYAQPPGGGPRGGRPPGGGPEEMVAREKQSLYEKATDLSEDQKALLDGIYDEFVVTMKESFESARESGSFKDMREKMDAIREEKDSLIKDVLSEDQYAIYESIAMDKRRKKSEGDAEEQPAPVEEEE